MLARERGPRRGAQRRRVDVSRADRLVPLTALSPTRHRTRTATSRASRSTGGDGAHLIGFADHTLAVARAWMTAALGWICIEMHHTLDPRAAQRARPFDQRHPRRLPRWARLRPRRDAAQRRVDRRAESERMARTYARRSVGSGARCGGRRGAHGRSAGDHAAVVGPVSRQVTLFGLSTP